MSLEEVEGQVSDQEDRQNNRDSAASHESQLELPPPRSLDSEDAARQPVFVPGAYSTPSGVERRTHHILRAEAVLHLMMLWNREEDSGLTAADVAWRGHLHSSRIVLG
jgi:hypothetical protein